MIAIINYEMGNLGAVKNMLKKIKVKEEVLITSNYKDILKASKIILPGVGSFDEGMKNLLKLRLIDAIYTKVEEGSPILGICLGMQILMEKSEEGKEKGLSLIEGEVVKFRFKEKDPNLKIPHMGWNIVKPTNYKTLFKNFEEKNIRFYFVHSYHVVCNDKAHILGWTNYEYDFASAISKNNIFGVQFHPEKSHKFGMKLFKNFVEL